MNTIYEKIHDLLNEKNVPEYDLIRFFIQFSNNELENMRI